ncbi:hypothetical protein CXB51_002120 [Gossypium anomalum]|uniref:Ribulose bisphosphate carboxylase large subunit C-terminal domain-containing protein n=1 Tax=Gossypium anomalum TaxID=47600 RepID=A0A8J6DB63_9ROSI|nr:hypothetical protein CXB51_002120 [Gossypium anomalum]
MGPSEEVTSSVFFQKSVLTNLIQEIEPLDISLIQRDVPPSTVDAMKRTISDMLGLLPSDRFQVFIEALWEPLSKLLISSMMTGYTLRNAEYRLCLERNLGCEECLGKTPDKSNFDLQEILLDSTKISDCSGKDYVSSEFEKTTEDKVEDIEFQSMGEISPETRKYILLLQSRLTSMKKGKNAALQMQQIAGEEKNDLLNYLRSLQPDKVAELSEPTSPELKETIHSVVHNLLTTLSPKMHSKTPPLSENTATGTVNNIEIEDCTELVGNTSLQLQPIISLTRDYLAHHIHAGTVVGKLEGERDITLGFVDLLRDDFIEKDRSRGIYFTQDWVSMPGVLPIASGGIHVWHMPALTEIFGDDSVLQFGGGTLGHPWGNAPGAVANRVALEACVQARNEGRDLAREGLEYRMELIELLSSTSKPKDNGHGDEQVI